MDPYVLISSMILMMAFVFVYSLHSLIFSQVAFLGGEESWRWLFWSLSLIVEHFHTCLVWIDLGSLSEFKGDRLNR